MPTTNNSPMRIALAQQNFLVGDIEGNAAIIAGQARKAAADGNQLIVFSELALTGYPPEDLLLRPSLQLRVEAALQQVAEASAGIAIAIGYPWRTEGGLYNCAGI